MYIKQVNYIVCLGKHSTIQLHERTNTRLGHTLITISSIIKLKSSKKINNEVLRNK